MSGVLPDTTVTSACKLNSASSMNAKAYNTAGTTASANGISSHSSINASMTDTKCSCDAYVTWINTQLAETSSSDNGYQHQQSSLLHYHRPNGAFSGMPVRDLSRDLRNGVVLARLAEKLGGEKLEKVHPHPVTRQQMLGNVDEVLKFALRWRVKMHPVLSTDIVDGDTRATLRLILALAAHFRPASVIRQIGGAPPQLPERTYANGSSQQFAKPVSLYNKQFPNNTNNNCDVYATPSPPTTPGRPLPPSSASPNPTNAPSPFSGGTTSPVNRQTQQLYSARLLKFKAVRSPRPVTSSTTAPRTPELVVPNDCSHQHSTKSLVQFPPVIDDVIDYLNNSRDESQVSSPLSYEAQAGSNVANSISSLETKPLPLPLLDEQDFDGLQSEIATAKKTLLLLQQMLFEQSDENGELLPQSEEIAEPQPSSPIATINGQMNSDYHHHSPVSSSVITSQFVDNSSSVSSERSTILQLRTQIRELNLTLEELAIEKRELECHLVDKDRQLSDLQAGLAERDRLVTHLQSKVHCLISEGRREVAELKELAVAATSPISEKTAPRVHVNNKNNTCSKQKCSNNGLCDNNNNNNASEQSLDDGLFVIKRDASSRSASAGTRLYYWNSDDSGPFCLYITKPSHVLSLRDVEQAFNRFGRKYRFRFFPLHVLEKNGKLTGDVANSLVNIDLEAATVDLQNDDDIVPGFDGQVCCRLEEII